MRLIRTPGGRYALLLGRDEAVLVEEDVAAEFLNLNRVPLPADLQRFELGDLGTKKGNDAGQTCHREPGGGADAQQATTFWHHGGDSYSLDGRTPIAVSDAASEVFTYFMTQEQPLAAQAKEIKAGCPSCTNPSKTFAEIVGVFGDTKAMRLPGRQGDRSGYFLHVRPLSKRG